MPARRRLHDDEAPVPDYNYGSDAAVPPRVVAVVHEAPVVAASEPDYDYGSDAAVPRRASPVEHPQAAAVVDERQYNYGSDDGS
jgi:hypothetical protein